MAEWKRIFRNRRLCIGLLVILLLNGFLFLREQKTQDYRIDSKKRQCRIGHYPGIANC